MTAPSAAIGPAHDRRVGLIVPSVNATIEPELYGASPPGFTFHAARVLLQETTPAGLRAMNDGLRGAAEQMQSLRPDLLVFACTSGSFVDGWEGHQRQLEMLADIVDCPVRSTSEAMVRALRHIGATSISLATPYLPDVAALEKAFLEEGGFEVRRERSLGLSGDAIREVGVDKVVRLVREADHPGSKAVYVSCTDLPTFDVIAWLEERLGKPVLSSNQVTLWSILSAGEWSGSVAGCGRLLQNMGEPT